MRGLLVAGKRPDLVKGLVLADPVILSRTTYFWNHVCPPVSALLHRNQMAARARKRRAEFPGFNEAMESYAGKAAFKSWREPFLADYLLDGLDRVDDGRDDSAPQTWRLLCEPKWEAKTFRAQRNPPWAAMRKVKKKRSRSSAAPQSRQRGVRQGARRTDQAQSGDDDEARARCFALLADGSAV